MNSRDSKDISKELTFRFTKSSGPGGQNVNKVNTRVEVVFNIAHSNVLNSYEKFLVNQKLSGRINKNGDLSVACESERSQLRNKENAIQKIVALIQKSLKKDKKRLPTKPTFSSRKKRLDKKKQLSSKKLLRKRPDY